MPYADDLHNTTHCLRATCIADISSKWLSSGDHLNMEHSVAPKWSPPAMYSSFSPAVAHKYCVTKMHPITYNMHKTETTNFWLQFPLS